MADSGGKPSQVSPNCLPNSVDRVAQPFTLNGADRFAQAAPCLFLLREVASMARRAKSGNNPNSVLIIFLVFFILSNIGFGVWVYTLTSDRDKWDVKEKEAQKQLAAAKTGQDWYKYQRDEMLGAMAEPDFMSKSELTGPWKQSRAAFIANQGPFANEEGAQSFRATIDRLDKILGASEESGYKEGFLKLAETLKNRNIELQTKLNQADKELKALQVARTEDLQTGKADLKKVADLINKENNQAIDERKAENDRYKEAMAQNADLAKKIENQAIDLTKEIKRKDGEIQKLKDKIQLREEIEKNANRALSEPHALILDIKEGKTLWDTARGKIIRIEESGRRVVINKGARDHVTVGLTFNVFATSPTGRGQGTLKATIEVVRVEDTMAFCRVNTIYDDAGREIAVNEATPASIVRQADNPLKEGDLIFNLFWGSHVAIFGILDFPGLGQKSPAEQMQNMRDFIHHLERTGITVDAYNDPRDGKIVGELTDKTSAVIRGASVHVDRKAAEEDTRAKAINDNLRNIREEAVNRGMFIISAENFAAMTGFRQPSPSGGSMTMDFTPRRPVGSPVTSVGGSNGK
jgi:hypothetical protein